MKHKKSMAVNALIVIIIALAAAIILIIAASRFALLSKDKADIETCRFSVMINSKVKEETFSILEDTTIQCDAIEYTAEPDHTEQDNLYSVAQHLDDCWYKMGAGEFEVFGQELTHQTHCLVCSEFTVNNDIITKKLDNTLEETKSQHSPNQKLNDFIKYEEYSAFSGVFNENGKEVTEGIIKKSNENNKNKYLIVYRRKALAQATKGSQKLLLEYILPEEIGDIYSEVIRKEFQDIFIVHEQGLANIENNQGNRNRREVGNKCDQLLWEKKIK